MFSIKKLLIFCSFLFLISCKDKQVVEEDPDNTKEFVGSYYTNTANETYGTTEDWVVERLDKNILSINYKMAINYSKPVPRTVTYNYALRNVAVKNATTIVLNENADVDIDGVKGRVKIEGTGTKSTASGLTKISIVLKVTELPSGNANTRELLDFKKK